MDETDLPALTMTEAIIAAHKAATRGGDIVALALIEPLLRHAGQRLAAAYGRCPCRADSRDLFDKANGRPCKVRPFVN